MLDIRAILDAHGVDYVASGPNVGRGNIAIRCPLCADDPSHHFGIHLKTGAWNCWRNQAHRGRSVVRLLMVVLGCGRDEAEALARQEGGVPDLALSDEDAVAERRRVAGDLPREFFPVRRQDGPRGMFWRYLRWRGFDGDQARAAAANFDLRGCLTGPFRKRLIVPVRTHEGLVTWTGRALSERAEVRYKTLALASDRARPYNPAARAASDCLLGEPGLVSGGVALFVCEGPLDAVRLDWFARDGGGRATCLFGMHLSKRQTYRLGVLAKRFTRVVLALDDAALGQALGIAREISFTPVVVAGMPAGFKDPGEFDDRAARRFVQRWSV